MTYRFQCGMKRRKLRKSNLPRTTQLGSERTWKFSNLGIFVLKTTEDVLLHEASEVWSHLLGLEPFGLMVSVKVCEAGV